MSYHLSDAELRTALGANAVTGLSDDNRDGMTVDQIITWGSALVDAAILNAGYTPPESDKCDNAEVQDLVKMATVGAIVAMLWGRKGLAPPESLNVFGSTFNELYAGNLRIPGLTPNARDAVGGVSFSSSDSRDPNGRPQIFGVLRKVY